MPKVNVLKRANRIREGSPLVTAAIYAALIAIGFITLYPFYYVVIQSIADPMEVVSGTAYFFPKRLYFGSYQLIFSDRRFWNAYLYTFIYVVSGTLLCLATSVLGAYPLNMKNLFGRKFLVRFLVFTMYFSGGLIPTFLLMINLNLYNNIWAMIIPSAVNVWFIILVRTFMSTVPEEMRESALIDGAGHVRYLLSILVPLCQPVLAVVAIYSVVGIWNSWFNAMVYLPNAELHPLQFYLYRVMIEQKVDMSQISNTLEAGDALQRMLRATQLKYSLIVFTTLPIIFTYPFFQRFFVKGVMLGSLKG